MNRDGDDAERQVLTAAFLSVKVASLGVQQVLQPIHDMMYTDTRRMDLPRSRKSGGVRRGYSGHEFGLR